MIFCLAAFFLLAVLGLTCWTLAFEWREKREAEEKYYENSDPANAERRKRREQIQASEQALHLINHHHHRQSAVVPNGCETTVLLIRHCEKPERRAEDDGHCSAIGFERADFLPTLFLGNHSRWPTPTGLYALTTERKHKSNYRAWETLLPLAEEIEQQNQHGSPATNSTAEAQESSMVQLVASPTQLVETLWLPQLQTGQLCGTVSVVAWKHSRMVALANAFGCGPRQGCPTFFSSKTYDAVWELTFVYTAPGTANGRSNSTAATGWHVFGSVLEQDFDPLEYRYEQGELYADDDDNDGGVPSSAKHHRHHRRRHKAKPALHDDADV